MKTANKKLLDPKANKEYYQKSDGNYMDIRMCTKAHLMLDRVKWVREKVHSLGSKYHLDVGTKDGYTCLTLASEGIECVGVDPSTDAIDEAKLRASELDLDVSFKVGYLEDLEVGEFKFDTVSMMEVLEHVLSPADAVAKLCKLAKFVLITTPDAKGRHGMEDSKQNIEHLNMFTKDELIQLCKTYGEIIECVERDEQLCILIQSYI